jgi:hypothetical protein
MDFIPPKKGLNVNFNSKVILRKNWFVPRPQKEALETSRSGVNLSLKTAKTDAFW